MILRWGQVGVNFLRNAPLLNHKIHIALTVAGPALETSLTVEEAERMLAALAAKGHLEVSAERGRLPYSLGEDDTPL